MWKPAIVIAAAERLTVTLRFLATGETCWSLSFQFRISRGAMAYIVDEVCKAVVKYLGQFEFKSLQHTTLSSESYWKLSSLIFAIPYLNINAEHTKQGIMGTDIRKVSVAGMRASTMLKTVAKRTNATFLFTLKNKRNVGWCWRRRLMKIKPRPTHPASSNIVQHSGQTSATRWIHQCWMMLHEHVGSVWPGLKRYKQSLQY